MKLFPGKGLLTSVKGQCLDKGHLGIQEGHMKVKYLSHQKLFLTLLIQIKGTFFFPKGHFLTKCLIPGCFIYLKQALFMAFKLIAFAALQLSVIRLHHQTERKIKKTTGQTKFWAVTIKQWIKLVLQHPQCK